MRCMGLVVLLLLLGSLRTEAATLASVTPSTIAVGSGNVTLTLTGVGFVQPVTAMWNNGGGACAFPLPTTLVSSTQLTAIVPAAEFAAAESAMVFVSQGGAATAPLPIAIMIPVATPILSSVKPQHAVQNPTSGVPITVTGTGFNSGSVIWFGSLTALTTTFVSSTQLTGVIPQTSLTTAGTHTVTVKNGTAISGAITFTIVGTLAISTATLPGGTMGVAYAATLAATGGKTPYTWSIVAGSLPAGLTLNAATGGIAGTPTGTGTAAFTVRCVDATGTLAFVEFPGRLAIGR